MIELLDALRAMPDGSTRYTADDLRPLARIAPLHGLLGAALARTGRGWAAPESPIDVFFALEPDEQSSIMSDIARRAYHATTQNGDGPVEEAGYPVVVEVLHDDIEPRHCQTVQGEVITLACTPCGTLSTVHIRLTDGEVLKLEHRAEIISGFASHVEHPGDAAQAIDGWGEDAEARRVAKRFLVSVWNDLSDEDRFAFLKRVAPPHLMRRALAR